MLEDIGNQNMGGSGNILNKYGSLPMTQTIQMRGRGGAARVKPRLMSTRRADPKARSGMPKTAVNYYNLCKGLYLKNSG